MGVHGNIRAEESDSWPSLKAWLLHSDDHD